MLASSMYYQKFPPPGPAYHSTDSSLPPDYERRLFQEQHIPFSTYQPDNLSIVSDIPINNLHPDYSSMGNVTSGAEVEHQTNTLLLYGSQAKLAASTNIDTNISDANDQRNSLYHKLSDIFGSETVLKMMSKYPLESDPKVLAKYIANDV